MKKYSRIQPENMHNNQHSQQGTTLLELLIVAVIMTTVILGASALVDNYTQNLRVAATAQHMTQFGNAVQAYIKDGFRVVDTNAHANASCVITVADLYLDPNTGAATTKYLPPGFNQTNSYGQDMKALVLQPDLPAPAAPGTPSGTLTALVVTEIARTDPNGIPINDVDLGQLAGLMGAAGGAIYTSTPSAALALNQAVGTKGKWKFDITSDPAKFFGNVTSHCSFTPIGPPLAPVTLAPGTPLLALWFSSDTSSAFLYRNQVGEDHPELNRMDTNLNFSDIATAVISNLKVLKNATDSAASAATITYGDPCGFNASLTFGGTHPPVAKGTLASDDKGSILVCQDRGDGTLLWQGPLFWGEPVPLYANLPTCSLNTYKWQTRVVQSPTPVIGSGRGPRAYTCDGIKWQPLAANDQGVLELGTSMTETSMVGCDAVYKGQMSMNSSGQLMTCQSDPNNPLVNRWTLVGSNGHYEFDIENTAGNAYPPASSIIPGASSPTFVGTGVIKTIGFTKTFTGTLWCNPRNPAKQPGNFYQNNWWAIDHDARPGGTACGAGGNVEPLSTGLDDPFGFPLDDPRFIAYTQAFNLDPDQIRWWQFNMDWDKKGYTAQPANVSVRGMRVTNVNNLWVHK